jgi:hypothetical protein
LQVAIQLQEHLETHALEKQNFLATNSSETKLPFKKKLLIQIEAEPCILFLEKHSCIVAGLLRVMNYLEGPLS